jgi:hypothetical protein
MVAIGQLAFGVALILGGALTAIDHPVIDRLNRWLKATGTSQHPSDIEMDETAALVGFIVGTFVILAGLLIVADAVA